MNKMLQAIPLGSEAAFPREEFERRLARLREIMARQELDLFVTTSPENIFYLCGHQTIGYYMFQVLCVPARGQPFMALRELESYNARANCFIEDILTYGDADNPSEFFAQTLKGRGWQGKRVAIDRNAWFLTVNIYERLAREFPGLLDGAGLVEPLRRIKSPLELASVEMAARVNDAGMRAGLKASRAGATENDVAAAVIAAAVSAGSEYPGIEPLITTGHRTGLPHAMWRRHRIKPGDVVGLETGGCHNRYHAALFRTVAVGHIPDVARGIYPICLEALEAAMAKAKPGNRCADVHNAAQAVIDKRGATERFRKKAGYSLGISFAPDWGEHAVLSLHHNVDVKLEPGMVFHLPMSLREFGQFTMAVSETIVITEDGCRQLSTIPRELVEA